MKQRWVIGVLAPLLAVVIALLAGAGPTRARPLLQEPIPTPPLVDFERRTGLLPSSTLGTIQVDPATLGQPLLGGALEGKVDLSASLPPIGDQGPQNSCVGWAIGYIKTYQRASANKGHASEHQPSPA